MEQLVSKAILCETAQQLADALYTNDRVKNGMEAVMPLLQDHAAQDHPHDPSCFVRHPDHWLHLVLNVA